MRLPCDAALLVIDLQDATDDPPRGARNNPEAETVVAALLEAWRIEGLPIFHIRRDPSEGDSAHRPGEAVIATPARSAFVGTALEESLEAIGATTLVVCGARTNVSVEATVRHGGDLGYRIFVVADACWTVAMHDRGGRLWSAEEIQALSLANLQGAYAEVVDGATALQAAALANLRRRRR
jgi:nicotinamidase-related amidase